MPTAPPADNPGRRSLAGLRVVVRVGMAVGMGLLAVPVLARGDRVEVDPGGLERRLGLGVVALRVVAGQRTPGLHDGATSLGASAALARYASTHRV